jgi:hypothetical protein
MALSEQVRGAAWHGMCELTNGMAGERHGHGMLCVNRPLLGMPEKLGLNLSPTGLAEVSVS